MELFIVLVVGLFFMQISCVANANFVFPVERKFKVNHSSLDGMKNHDSRRHGRLLYAAELPLGGDGLFSGTGLYYAKLGLGSPVKHFYVQVDTGSNAFWVNCAVCKGCPKKTDLVMHLTRYDPNDSKTSDFVSCHDYFCTSPRDDTLTVGSCTQDMSCAYSFSYGDGSIISGFYIKDYVTFNQIKSNLRTVPKNDTIIFGCGTHASGPLSSSPSNLDGIVGFGPSNDSMLSQLAASGKVKRKFSHCLDSINGGGIFSIGEVVAPKFNTTPFRFMSNLPWYVVVMKDVEVDGEAIQVRNGITTIIDSGATFAYLTASVHDKLVTKILARQPGLKSYLHKDEYTCFNYSNNLDDGFPVVKLHFEGLYLTLYPHDYMFFLVNDEWCIGWRRNLEDGPIVLGDLVLSNRLVVYDLEEMTLGWMNYNCSTSIRVKDDKTGSVYTVGATHLHAKKPLSSASTVLIGRILTLLLIALLSTYTTS